MFFFFPIQSQKNLKELLLFDLKYRSYIVKYYYNLQYLNYCHMILQVKYYHVTDNNKKTGVMAAENVSLK